MNSVFLLSNIFIVIDKTCLKILFNKFEYIFSTVFLNLWTMNLFYRVQGIIDYSSDFLNNLILVFKQKNA